jgi:hypothetical protein
VLDASQPETLLPKMHALRCAALPSLTPWPNRTPGILEGGSGGSTLQGEQLLSATGSKNA